MEEERLISGGGRESATGRPWFNDDSGTEGLDIKLMGVCDRNDDLVVEICIL
jgi:hypothetical protein